MFFDFHTLVDRYNPTDTETIIAIDDFVKYIDDSSLKTNMAYVHPSLFDKVTKIKLHGTIANDFYLSVAGLKDEIGVSYNIAATVKDVKNNFTDFSFLNLDRSPREYCFKGNPQTSCDPSCQCVALATCAEVMIFGVWVDEVRQALSCV